MIKWLFDTFCPACGKGETSTWTHRDCGGDLYIWYDGDLQCDKCRTFRFILDWRFACDYHKGDFQSARIQSVLRAISTVAQMSQIPFEAYEKLEEKIKNEAKTRGLIRS